MAEIIPFEDIVRTRARRRDRAALQQCLEVLRLNLAYNEVLLESAAPGERAIYRKRVEQLAALLEYGERIA